MSIGLLFVAAITSAFNLECAGEHYNTTGIFGPKENAQPFSITYRIDLASERYCYGNCQTTKPLFRVNPTQIVFAAEERGELDDTLTYVNRESGEYLDRLRWYGNGDVHIIMSIGKCKRSLFTGFPTRQF